MRDAVRDVERCRELARDFATQIDRDAGAWQAFARSFDVELQNPTTAIRLEDQLHSVDPMRREDGRHRGEHALAVESWQFYVGNRHPGGCVKGASLRGRRQKKTDPLKKS